MTSTVLICTVGGSHQPIVTAIGEIQPDFVSFLCTDRDPATGQPGSRLQVEGEGPVIKAHPADPAPTLPNIPVQAGLPDGAWEVRPVPADALDGVAEAAAEALAGLRRRFPEARRVADYTGGTKTMTAGLVLAALDEPDVELRLVTGPRADLVRVHDGAQGSAASLLDHLEIRNASILAHGFTPVDEAGWRRFHGWLERALLPVLRQAAAEDGFRMDPPQLPTGPIWQ